MTSDWSLFGRKLANLGILIVGDTKNANSTASGENEAILGRSFTLELWDWLDIRNRHARDGNDPITPLILKGQDSYFLYHQPPPLLDPRELSDLLLEEEEGVQDDMELPPPMNDTKLGDDKNAKTDESKLEEEEAFRRREIRSMIVRVSGCLTGLSLDASFESTVETRERAYLPWIVPPTMLCLGKFTQLTVRGYAALLAIFQLQGLHPSTRARMLNKMFNISLTLARFVTFLIMDEMGLPIEAEDLRFQINYDVYDQIMMEPVPLCVGLFCTLFSKKEEKLARPSITMSRLFTYLKDDAERGRVLPQVLISHLMKKFEIDEDFATFFLELINFISGDKYSRAYQLMPLAH